MALRTSHSLLTGYMHLPGSYESAHLLLGTDHEGEVSNALLTLLQFPLGLPSSNDWKATDLHALRVQSASCCEGRLRCA